MKRQHKLFILLALIGTIAATSSYRRDSYSESESDSDEPSNADYWDDVEGGPFKFTGKIRKYYIAADEIAWNYAPNETNILNGSDFDANAREFTVATPTRIGGTYLKCLYQEYTDDTFTKLIPRTEHELHLGYLGPIVRAEVGDIIKIDFLNNCRFPASVHPHAVFYNKDGEGAPYNDTTSGFNKSDDAVPTGGRHTYKWWVPKRAGPGPTDGSSIMWMYHSHTDETIDVWAGLVGPMAITRKGYGDKHGAPKDVHREMFYMYMMSEENRSPYLQDSFDLFSLAEPGAPLPTDGGFTAANRLFNINGYIYGNGPLLTLKKGERCRWYVMSMGSFFDSHTPVWHGNTITMMGTRMNMMSLLPAEMATGDMCPDAKGTWMFHCHVGDHLIDGMATLYRVVDNEKEDEDSYDDDNDSYDYDDDHY